MLERRPDLCAAVYEDLWRSRFGEEDATNKSAYPLPVWGVRDGKFTSHYSRTYVEANSCKHEASIRTRDAVLERAHGLQPHEALRDKGALPSLKPNF